MLLNHPAMELDPDTPPFELRQWDGAVIRTTDWLRFKPGVDPATVTFETGYAAAARDSYGVFRRLRDAGEIPAGVRFQVCLPTPMASGYMYVSPASLAAYLPAYERALLAALRDITDAIPHRDLSVQWDVCQEVLVFEALFRAPAGRLQGRMCSPNWHAWAMPCRMTSSAATISVTARRATNTW